MFFLYSLSLQAPTWPIGVRGPRVLPVRAHSSYATVITSGNIPPNPLNDKYGILYYQSGVLEILRF
jgi:hypothetical protein